MKRTVTFTVLSAILLSLMSFSVFAWSPEITNPTSNQGIFRNNYTVRWTSGSGVTHKISLYDKTVGRYVFKDVSVGTSTSYTIDKKYFYDKHEYTVSVQGTNTNGLVATFNRDFYIQNIGNRNLNLSRGLAMNSYSWKPKANLQCWKFSTNNYTYSSGSTYQGIPYTQKNHNTAPLNVGGQSKLSSISLGSRVTYAYVNFDTAFSNSSASSVFIQTVPVHHIMEVIVQAM